MKKIFSLMFALTAMLAISSCGKTETTAPQPSTASPTTSKTEKQDAKNPFEGRTLKILSCVSGGKTPEEQKLFIQELSKRLGFNVDMVMPASDYDNVVMRVLASGENYDVIYMTTEKLPVFVQQGAVTDLTDIIKNSKVLSDPTVVPPAEYDLIKIDGKIYGVPNKFEGGRLPIVREDWIKEFGMKDPVTLDDWLKYWDMAKKKKNAYGLSTQGLIADLQPWASAWGLKDGYVIKDGKRTIPYASDAAIPFWAWLAKAYKAGYIDPNFEVNMPKEFRNNFYGNQAATVGYWDAFVGIFNNVEKERYKKGQFIAKGINGVPGPDGKVLLTRGDSSIWVIPSNAKNVDMATKFFEFWHSPAGYILGSVGVEGFDYNLDKDGKIVLTKIGEEHSLDHGVPRVTSTTWKYPFGLLPGVQDAQDIIMNSGAVPMNKPVEWLDARKIMEHWAFKAIKGEITPEEAVKNMQKELKENKLID